MVRTHIIFDGAHSSIDAFSAGGKGVRKILFACVCGVCSWVVYAFTQVLALHLAIRSGSCLSTTTVRPEYDSQNLRPGACGSSRKLTYTLRDASNVVVVVMRRNTAGGLQRFYSAGKCAGAHRIISVGSVRSCSAYSGAYTYHAHPCAQSDGALRIAAEALHHSRLRHSA